MNKGLNKEYLDKILGLSESDKSKLRSGNGFVKVPLEEIHRQRIDAYPAFI